MLRGRDLLAILAVVLLTRMAWRTDDALESLSASVHLSFYIPSHDIRKVKEHARKDKVVDDDDDASDGHVLYETPAMLDVDGDGTAEALALLVQSGASWKIQILDLKPGMTRQAVIGAPFRPQVLLESKTMTFPTTLPNAETAEPIHVTTGHILNMDAPSVPSISDSMISGHREVSERTRHYFCGKDWHEASEKCSAPCPGGASDECPGEDRCFADTSCDYYEYLDRKKREKNKSSYRNGQYQLTPVGSLPSVVTLWDSGLVTMHGLTAVNSTGTGKNIFSLQPKVQVQQLWETNPLQNYSIEHWDDHDVNFVSATDAQNGHGLILVTASVELAPGKLGEQDDDFVDPIVVQFVVALDARSGDVIWDTLREYGGALQKAKINGTLDKEQENLPLPLPRGSTSMARRRSLNPNVAKSREQTNMGDDDSPSRNAALMASSLNCMHSYRRSLLTAGALPFVHWTPDDTKSHVLHFDHQQAGSNSHGHGGHGSHRRGRHGPGHKLAVGGGKVSRVAKRWLLPKNAGKRKSEPKKGRPNVVVTHNANGLHVRSLKNGRSLCHLSLWEGALYDDINHDGILESVNVVVGSQSLEDDDQDPQSRWLHKLVQNVEKLDGKKDMPEVDKEMASQRIQEAYLCHLQVLSGIPSKEELFSVNICGSRRDQQEINPQYRLAGSPPIVMEPFTKKKGHDILAAVGTGFVTRIDGSTGRQQWQWAGGSRRHPHLTTAGSDVPAWEDDALPLVTRIDSHNVIPATRPILVAGENSLVVLSARHGYVLASAEFPQPSIIRPRIMDLNGDGTTDLIVISRDALWGYQIRIRTGSSFGFRMIVGLVLLGMMLALLRNRFGPHPGKRSTDA